jgi:antitoxin PrlF
MAKEKKTGCCATGGDAACCRVEAIVGVDDRGQVVLPKEVREKAGIKAGDKLAVVSWNLENETTCLFMLKTDELAAMVKDILGPVAKEIIKP